MKLNDISKIELAIKPTPIQRLKSFSHEYGCSIFVKRDDLLGVSFGGNKVRKLEYILADAKKKGAKLIAASGSLQTNHGLLTALCSARLGMKCLLFLLIEEKGTEKCLSGNLLLDDYAGGDTVFVDISDIMTDEALSVGEKDALSSEKLEMCMERALKEFQEREGISAAETYAISSAGSVPLGILGYVDCMKEIAEQSDTAFDYLFCGNGSGGTYGGMVLGGRLYQPGARVIGVGIEEMNPEKPAFIVERVNQAAELIGTGERISENDLTFLFNSVNRGYAVPDEETMRCIEDVARREGFFLDPVYSGKVMNGALKYIGDNLRDTGKNILILHSGGGPGLYNRNMIDYRSRSSKVLDRWKHDTD